MTLTFLKEATTMKRKLYPGTKEAEKAKSGPKDTQYEEDPDFIVGYPNYDKFYRMGWDCEKTLSWLNID